VRVWHSFAVTTDDVLPLVLDGLSPEQVRQWVQTSAKLLVFARTILVSAVKCVRKKVFPDVKDVFKFLESDLPQLFSPIIAVGRLCVKPVTSEAHSALSITGSEDWCEEVRKTFSFWTQFGAPRK
jgi:hypothetical protein